MNRLIITGYVGGDHDEIVADVNAEDGALLRSTAIDIAARVRGVHTEAAVRRNGDVIELSTPGFAELDGSEIELESVGERQGRLTRMTLRTRPLVTTSNDDFLAAGLFTARTTARLQRVG